MNGHNPNPRHPLPERRAVRRGLVPSVPKIPAAGDAPKPHGRHAAITDHLNNLNNYKRWAENIRSTWGNDK